MQFCKDCKYYEEYPFRGYCVNPKNGIDLVNGSTKAFSASLVRGHTFECGTEARWFEPKIKKPTLWQRLTGSKN